MWRIGNVDGSGILDARSGLVRSKNTTEILTKKRRPLRSFRIMYLICGYAIMYDGSIFLKGINGGTTLVADALVAPAENGFGGDAVFRRVRLFSK